MKRLLSLAVLVLVCTALLGAGKARRPAGYDEKRDPAADLKAAIAEAQRDDKRILMEVGGEWCSWCHILNDLFTDDKEISARLHDNFVVIKVNFEPRGQERGLPLAVPEDRQLSPHLRPREGRQAPARRQSGHPGDEGRLRPRQGPQLPDLLGAKEERERLTQAAHIDEATSASS